MNKQQMQNWEKDIDEDDEIEALEEPKDADDLPWYLIDGEKPFL